MPAKTVDAYVAALPAGQQEVVAALRRLVLASAPWASESIKWAQPVYEDHGPFAYIKAHRSHVTFGFWRGLELQGGRAILESSGVRMAHVKLTTVGDIDTRLLQSLVKQAVKLNRAQGDPTKAH